MYSIWSASSRSYFLLSDASFANSTRVCSSCGYSSWITSDKIWLSNASTEMLKLIICSFACVSGEYLGFCSFVVMYSLKSG